MKKITLNLLIVFSILICFKTTNGQSTTLGNVFGPLKFIGYNFPSGHLDIGNADANPIRFYTNGHNGFNYPFLTSLRMIIYDDPLFPFNEGFVGIGGVFQTQSPQNILHIDGGGSANTGPLGAYTQWTNARPNVGNTTPTMGLTVGIDTWGNAIFDNYALPLGMPNGQMIFRFNTTPAGLLDQFFGNTTFGYKTFPPPIAPVNSNNTAIGVLAMANSNPFQNNTALGYQALTINNSSGLNLASDNSAFGKMAGSHNVDGSFNVFMGTNAGLGIVTGGYNVLIGENTQPSVDVSKSVTLGGNTSVEANDATAIGFGCDAPHVSTLILGSTNSNTASNYVNVGIGYSGFIPGPQALLDVWRGNFVNMPNPTGINIQNDDVSSTGTGTATGITNTVDGLNSSNHGMDINITNAFGANYGGVIRVSNPSNPGGLCYDLRIYAHDGIGNTGVRGAVYDGLHTGYTRNAGIEFYVGSSNGDPTSWDYGGLLTVNNNTANHNFGLWAEVSTSSSSSATNVGVYAYTPIAGGSANAAGSNNIAVYGDLGISGCPCPITGPSKFAGYFNGDLVYTSACYLVSDSALKQNVQPLTNPMATLNLLFPKQYEFNQQQNPSMQLESGTHFGIMAQNLYNVLPQLTKHVNHPARYDSLGNMTYDSIPYLAVNTIELIPYLIAAAKVHDSTINALTAQNNSMQSQINNLSNIIDSCCNIRQQQRRQNKDDGNGGNNDGGNDSNSNNIDVSLSSQSIVLFQNVPNPFKEQTVISYTIPDNLTDVKIVFTDNLGNIIKEVPISSHGPGQLTVYAQDLSSGIYTYTIISNGITIDSKRMVKMK